MPMTSTSGFDISSDTCCSPISASPLETSTLTRPLGPPAASLTFGVTSAAMPSRWNTLWICAAVMLPPAGAAWPTVLAASSVRLSASGDDTSGLGAPLRTAIPMPVRARSGSHDLAPLDELVDRGAVGQEQVDGLAAVEAGDQRAGRGIARANGVAVRAREGRQQFVRRRLDRGRDEGVDLGGVGGRGRSEHGDDDYNYAHDSPATDPAPHHTYRIHARRSGGVGASLQPAAIGRQSPAPADGRSATCHLAWGAQTR